MAQELSSIKRDVAVANRILAEVGLATGLTASRGHASLRVPDDPERFVVKGRGYAMDILAVMQPDDMVVCDLDGAMVEGREGLSPPSEVKMHSCIYRARPEVQSVIHVHPRFIILMGVLQAELHPMSREGAQLVTKPLPLFPSSRLIVTEEDGQEVAATLGDALAIMLKGHGIATVGISLDETFMAAYRLEEQAMMNWYAYCAAGPDHAFTPPEEVEGVAAPGRRLTRPERPAADGRRRADAVWLHLADVVTSRDGI